MNVLRMWTEFDWFKIGHSGGLLKALQGLFGFRKMRGIWLAEQLLSSQEGLYFMSYFVHISLYFTRSCRKSRPSFLQETSPCNGLNWTALIRLDLQQFCMNVHGSTTRGLWVTAQLKETIRVLNKQRAVAGCFTAGNVLSIGIHRQMKVVHWDVCRQLFGYTEVKATNSCEGPEILTAVSTKMVVFWVLLKVC
jgi:hypothetical protein